MFEPARKQVQPRRAAPKANPAPATRKPKTRLSAGIFLLADCNPEIHLRPNAKMHKCIELLDGAVLWESKGLG